MAWLQGLAGKAENLLNKIDQDTAAVLQKDKHESKLDPLIEVTWNSSNSVSDVDLIKNIPRSRSALNLSSRSPFKSSEREDATFSNLHMQNFGAVEGIMLKENQPTPAPFVLEQSMENTDTLSEVSAASGNSSPTLIEIKESPKLIENSSNDFKINFEKENTALKSEVQRLSDDLCLVTTNNDKSLENERYLKERNEFLGKRQTDFQKEINALREKLRGLEMERLQFLKQVSDLQSTVERNRLELSATQSELEQHRARALKTLQEKEKLIVELRSNTDTGKDDTTLTEINQLKLERDALRDENQQICEQLRVARQEAISAEISVEKMRQQSTEAGIQAQELVASERRRRLDAEEDARIHSEEVRSLKEELIRQNNTFSLKIQQRESEISRLRTQLSAASTPSSEVESRLSSLTQTLVLKQQALENLTTERNALRLQLEKIEHEFRNMINPRKNVSYNNVNDTDDAKAQVPTFLMETPFDTGVARRVKRAYSSLHAISIRTGVFLRRYPLARILVLFYIILLQFWVVVVLLSQSLDAH